MRPIERWIGMRPQFRRGTAGDVYRQDGYGPPIPVTAAEREAFIRAGTRSFGWHVAGFVLATVAGALVVSQILAGGVARAAATAVIASIIGAILYASHRSAVHAPARALTAAGRRPIGPAEAPPLTRWPSYPMILGGVLIAIFAIAQSVRTTAASTAAFSIVAIAVGLGVAVLKWRYERRFTPAQKVEAKVQRREVRSQFSFGALLVFLVFTIVEIVVMVLAFALTLGAIFQIAGTTMADPAPVPLVIGLILAFAAAGLVAWPIERLCRRLIGTTPGDFFGNLPI